jgi:hypothetical protein
MPVPLETVLLGGLRLDAPLGRQRRGNIIAWAEGPGRRDHETKTG